MRQDLIDNGFVVVKNFLGLEEAVSLYKRFKEIYTETPGEFTQDCQCPRSPGIMDAYVFLALLVNKVPHMSEIIGEQVFPTYCYARHYRQGEVLLKHVDRDACEISVSVHLGGDADWKLSFKKPNGEEVGLSLKPGEAAVYLGCTTEHWREGEYQGQEYGQVFLHYVCAAGENNWTYFDKRR